MFDIYKLMIINKSNKYTYCLNARITDVLCRVILHFLYAKRDRYIREM